MELFNYLLVILLGTLGPISGTLGPISVDCYPCTKHESIARCGGMLSPEERASTLPLMRQDMEKIRAKALNSVYEVGIIMTNVAGSTHRVPELGRFSVDGTLVIGILFHQQPPVLLSIDEHVYVEIPREQGERAART